MAHDVFISYSVVDKLIADAVCARLEERKIRCWIAPRNVLPSANFGAALTHAIHDCRVMVLILSASSNTSQYVNNEVGLAVGSAKVIVPFRIEELDLSPDLRFFLATVHWLDALTPPLEKHLDRLATTVSLLLTSHPTAPSPGEAHPNASGAAPPFTEPAPRPRRFPAWRSPTTLAALLLTIALALLAAVFAATHRRPGPAEQPPQTAGTPSPGGSIAPEAKPPETDLAPMPPPVDEPELPENPIPRDADADRPLLPTDPKRTMCAVIVQNETGHPLKIWRHVYRPEGHRQADRWRHWPIAPDMPQPPPSVAGWTYFVVEDTTNPANPMMNYKIVGWRFLRYGGLATIRLKADFFNTPATDDTFAIAYAE